MLSLDCLAKGQRFCLLSHLMKHSKSDLVSLGTENSVLISTFNIKKDWPA